MTMHDISVIMLLFSVGCFLAAIVQRRWPSAVIGIALVVIAVPMYLLSTL